MDILFSETDPEYFGFEIDTFWIQSGGANPVEWIYKVNGRMDVVHFKDMAIKEDQQIFAEIGEGNLNWDAIVKACRETGVKWYAIEQDKCLRDPFDSLTMSLKYLGKYL
jgi:sugar phosphate isomerase/epimerase